MRVIALVAFVVAALGVTVANAHSPYKYSGFMTPDCSDQSPIGAQSLVVLIAFGVVAYVDNDNSEAGCKQLVNPGP